MVRSSEKTPTERKVLSVKVESGRVALMRTIKILGYRYKVDSSKTQKQIGGFAGGVLLRSQTIQIAKDVCKQTQESTLIHEILEVLNFHLGLSMPHKMIVQLEAGFYGVLRDNGIDVSGLVKK